jgi:HD-GYP domain-containing protein (c-di-GMP phosphodiesterase class II)
MASPQQVYVAAPKAVVWVMLRGTEYNAPHDSGRNISVLSDDGAQTLIEFSSQARRSVKAMTVAGPHRLLYRHQSGLYTGAVEELVLRDTGLGTELVMTGSLAVRDGVARGLIKMAFERMLYEHLRDIKQAAESRAANTRDASASTVFLADVPALATEAALLQAAARQEEVEWGHSGHGQGVARIALSLATGLDIGAKSLAHLQHAALLHDVGKIAIDNAIWGARGPIGPGQRAHMAAHPVLGRDLALRAGLPEPVLDGILHHHERWDGQGYPDGLSGDAIALPVRILALAESIDSMLRASYRRAPLHTPEVVARLETGAGRQWDPVLARKAKAVIRGR